MSVLCVGLALLVSQSGLSSEKLDEHVAKVLKARVRCGPIAAWYCLRRHGKPVTPTDVFDQAKIDSAGVSLGELIALCESNRVQAQGLCTDPGNVRCLPAPSILILGSIHCVVYEGIDPETGYVRIFEPSAGKMKMMTSEELQSIWTGEAVVFESPSPGWAAFWGVMALTAVSVLCAGITIHRLLGG